MLLLATLFFFISALNGHPTFPDKPIVQLVPVVFRRDIDEFKRPNPETGLCDCPDMRTLREIIWTCASTLILAAWVAVHFNVQPLGLSPFRRAMTRAAMLLTTILGPELTLFWAFKEWHASREIDGWFKETYHHWTTTHSFYLLMGGFSSSALDGTPKAIHPLTFKERLDKGEIEMPSITEEEIKDKSKGDGLAKAIAVTQLIWFSVQLIMRLAKGWAATELEVLTFATCIMTVGMYAFWWNKPLNVRCPTQVLLRLIPQPDGKLDTGKVDDDVGPLVEVSIPMTSKEEQSKHEEDAVKLELSVANAPKTESQPIADKSQSFPDAGVTDTKETPTNDWAPFYQFLFENTSTFGKCLLPISLPILLLLHMPANSTPTDWDESPPPVGSAAVEPITQDDVYDKQDFFQLAVFLVFGGLHFITWSFDMPTKAELWMWRISSILLCAIPLVVLLVYAIVVKYHLFDDSPSDSPTPLGSFLAGAVAFTAFALYPIVRLIISIDSLVLLRKLPPTAYLSLSWSSIVPSL